VFAKGLPVWLPLVFFRVNGDDGDEEEDFFGERM
jgi:hypothetical protein